MSKWVFSLPQMVQKVTCSSLVTRASKHPIIKFYLLHFVSLSGFQNVLKHIYLTFGRLKFHLSFFYAYSFLFDYFNGKISENRLTCCMGYKFGPVLHKGF